MMATADVIVIGTGPAGISAAWPLVEAGLKVLMLDASDAEEPPMPPPQDSMQAWRKSPDRWHHELGRYGPIVRSTRSPKFTTPLSQATLAGFDAAAGIFTDGYSAVGSRSSGGLSRIWGALATPFSEQDLVAWGAHRSALMESYDRVSKRVGISKAVVSAEPLKHLMKVYERNGASDGFTLDRAQNAVLDETRGDRTACNGCGLCLYGCGRGSIYQSAQELTQLAQFANFGYQRGTWVTSLSKADGRHVVHARQGANTVAFSAPTIVLAAGTLMTTKLVLRLLGMFGQPIRLENNPVGGTAFIVPSMIGRSMSKHSFGLGQLFYSLKPSEDVEAVGVLYGADTLPLASIADRLPFTRPVALQLARFLSPSLILATGYLPGRWSDNQLILEDDKQEGRLVLQGKTSPQAQNLMQETFRRLGRHVQKLGGWMLPGATQHLEPGSDAHPGGTLPMGGPGPAATDFFGEVQGQQGIYVADGACLPLLSARHSTLTIMANADRIGRTLALRSGSKR